MDGQSKIYGAIDLKSFYASVECIERGLDPMTANLVVADRSRTEKTICLAVSPALKEYGVPGRPRLFQVEQRVKEINRQRERAAGELKDSSYDNRELKREPSLALSYITAVPRMAYYMDYSTRIYSIYLKYFAPEDIHVYSIDEVFIDLTGYLGIYKLEPRELIMKIIREVLKATGITATAGIGTNLYLSKVAMDIVAKHIPADKDGVRIAELNEKSYRRLLWSHRPITDFWRVGRGYAKRLEECGIYTMGDVARCSLGGERDYYNEELLYKLFGVNAELLIDHAWGWEPCTVAQIKAYKPSAESLGSGQVLQCPHDFNGGRLIVREMADALALDLVDKRLVTDQMVLTVGYDIENLTNPQIAERYKGEVTTDRYGRRVPKHAHGTIRLKCKTSSARLIMEGVTRLYERIVDKNLLIRRLNLTAANVTAEDMAENTPPEQLDLFTDYNRKKAEETELKKERDIQRALLDIKKKYGKNAVLKGMSLQEGATAAERNRQIGGHRA